MSWKQIKFNNLQQFASRSHHGIILLLLELFSDGCLWSLETNLIIFLIFSWLWFYDTTLFFSMGGNVSLSGEPPLWSRPKYLNIYWMECREIRFRRSILMTLVVFWLLRLTMRLMFVFLSETSRWHFNILTFPTLIFDQIPAKLMTSTYILFSISTIYCIILYYMFYWNMHVLFIPIMTANRGVAPISGPCT